MSDAEFPKQRLLFNRAKQCQSIARKLVDRKSRSRMIELALGYKEIAKSAAKLKTGNRSGNANVEKLN